MKLSRIKGDVAGSGSTVQLQDIRPLYQSENPTLGPTDSLRPNQGRMEHTAGDTKLGGAGTVVVVSSGRPWKNLMVVSVAFMVNFTAYQSMQNLQSSLNSESSLGVLSLSLLYATLISSALFLAPPLVKTLGCKWTIALSFLPYAMYMGANFYPTWYTLLPCAVLLGTMAAPLWAAKCTYLTELGRARTTVTLRSLDVTLAQYFGVFFMTFQTSQIWGNLISGLVLQEPPSASELLGTEDTPVRRCGAFYRNYMDTSQGNVTITTVLDRRRVWILSGVYTGLALLASLIVIIFLDSDPTGMGKRNHGNEEEEEEEEESEGRGRRRKCTCDMLVETTQHWRKMDQILLIPITIYSGLEQAFLAADFTQSYVSCTLGVWMVGMVLICFGISNSVCCFLISRLVRVMGRPVLFALGGVIHCVLQAGLFFWFPSRDHLPAFFAIAALWGAADAIWNVCINALYGCVFLETKEAAFSNYRLWESVGFIIAFTYSGFVFTYVKIIVLLCSLIVGMLGYFIVEGRQRVGAWKR